MGGGQFWTPITPNRGSIFHADQHAALDRVLSACRSTEMVFATSRSTPAPAKPKVRLPAASGDTVDALRLYDDNRNGRITCSEARRHGIAPVPRGHPAYRFMRDGDGDGVVCE